MKISMREHGHWRHEDWGKRTWIAFEYEWHRLSKKFLGSKCSPSSPWNTLEMKSGMLWKQIQWTRKLKQVERKGFAWRNILPFALCFNQGNETYNSVWVNKGIAGKIILPRKGRRKTAAGGMFEEKKRDYVKKRVEKGGCQRDCQRNVCRKPIKLYTEREKEK